MSLTPGGNTGEGEDLRNGTVDELKQVVLIASWTGKICK